MFPCRAGDEEHVDPQTGEVVTLTAKSPLTSNGLKAATLFPHIIKRWWRDNPDAMIGIPTGEKTGVWVLDVDVSDGKPGEATLAALEAANDNLPQTRTARTASGGRHIYFEHHEGVRNRGALGVALDVRGSGGYVVAPGSVTADGRTYEWLDDNPILPAPQWLLDLVLPSAAPERPANYKQYKGENSAYVNAAIDDELANLASTPQGARNNAINDAAYALGQFVGSGALARSEAESALMSITDQWPNTRLSNGTIARGLDAGMKQPRDIPEPIYHDEVLEMDFSKLIANSRRKLGLVVGDEASDLPDGENVGAGQTKKAGDKVNAANAETIAAEVAVNKPDMEAAKQPAGKDAKAPASKAELAAKEPASETPKPLIHATPFAYTNPALLPRREFLYGTHLIRKYVSVTVSPGGLGKTSLTIAEALAMVTGKPLLGVKTVKPLRVWVFNSEDPRDEMERRIMAAAKHYKVTSDQIGGRLFMDTGREQSLVVAFDDKRGIKIAVPIVEAVVAQILENEIDVMVIDPFVSTHSVNENDNGAIDAVAKLWARVADETNCAIEVVHHVRKSEGREVTVEDGRGAGSLLAAARSARVLNRMSEDQASAAGLPKHERFSYFNVTYGKANLSPMNGSLQWLKMESVPLGNGQGMTKPQDHVGVVTQWEWPSAENVVDAISGDVRGRIVSLLNNGEYKAAPQAKEAWAGCAVAEAMGLDMDSPEQKKRAGVVLAAMLKEGVLVVEEERDPVARKTVKMVRGA